MGYNRRHSSVTSDGCLRSILAIGELQNRQSIPIIISTSLIFFQIQIHESKYLTSSLHSTLNILMQRLFPRSFLLDLKLFHPPVVALNVLVLILETRHIIGSSLLASYLMGAKPSSRYHKYSASSGFNHDFVAQARLTQIFLFLSDFMYLKGG